MNSCKLVMGMMTALAVLSVTAVLVTVGYLGFMVIAVGVLT